MTTVVVSVSVITALYFTWCAHRLRRLRVRTYANAQVLDDARWERARRVLAYTQQCVQHSTGDLHHAAHAVLQETFDDAPDAENALTLALRAEYLTYINTDAGAQIVAAHRRMMIVRQLYNDAVRDTIALRTHRVLRLLRLPDPYPPPVYFDVLVALHASKARV